MITFVTLRTCDVEVQFLRGMSRGREGFWIVETCHSEKLSAISFWIGGAIPDALADVASTVLSFCDETGEGISGKGGAVRKVGGNSDSALFIVTARVEGCRPHHHCAQRGCTQTDGKPCAYAHCPNREAKA